MAMLHVEQALLREHAVKARVKPGPSPTKPGPGKHLLPTPLDPPPAPSPLTDAVSKTVLKGGGAEGGGAGGVVVRGRDAEVHTCWGVMEPPALLDVPSPLSCSPQSSEDSTDGSVESVTRDFEVALACLRDDVIS